VGILQAAGREGLAGGIVLGYQAAEADIFLIGEEDAFDIVHLIIKLLIIWVTIFDGNAWVSTDNASISPDIFHILWAKETPTEYTLTYCSFVGFHLLAAPVQSVLAEHGSLVDLKTGLPKGRSPIFLGYIVYLGRYLLGFERAQQLSTVDRLSSYHNLDIGARET